jgi:glycolate oxidase
MDLERGAYQALEDIVGPEYINEDPAIRDTYNQVWGNKLLFDEKWSTRPGAVILPASTEEIQAIIRVCNRHKVTFKAFASGFEVVGTAFTTENSVTLDLRRMDKILDIDVKNMRVLVEPFVSQHRLNLELAKHGLFTGGVSGGPSSNVIAIHCAHFGSGFTQVSTGGLGRNVLGCEWVLPTGELLTLGTGEAGSGWYSADGPGFSLRGILRGHSGANGGHGVITKAAVKLYPWYGPSEWELQGSPPANKVLPEQFDLFKVYVFTMADMDKVLDAMRAFGQSEVCYAVDMVHGMQVEEGNDEFMAKVMQMMQTNPDKLGALERSVYIAIGADTKREFDYKEKVLFAVNEKLGGDYRADMNDPQELAWRLQYLSWAFGTVRECFRWAGDFHIVPNIDGTIDAVKAVCKMGAELFKTYAGEGGPIMAPGGFPFPPPFENYSVGGHLEHVFIYDPCDQKSVEGTREFIGKVIDPKGEFGPYGVPCLGGGLSIEPVTHLVQNWGPTYDNYHVWMAKIKAMLDPNTVCDWSAYVPPVFP